MLTCVVAVAGTVWAYGRTRDPLHPLMLLGPMFVYMYVIRPLLVIDKLPAVLPNESLAVVTVVNLLGVACFVLACCSQTRRIPRGGSVTFRLSPVARLSVFRLGITLGVIAVSAYWYAILRSGGLYAVYSQTKGFASAGSGYIGEAPLLAFPAIVLLALSRAGQKIRISDFAIALVIASPHLLHGILGARRGPTFLVLATLLLSWYVTSNKRPRVWQIMLGMSAAITLVFFLIAHRGQIRLGSELEVDTGRWMETVFPTELYFGDDYVFGGGMIAVSSKLNRPYWGSRIAAILFIRPIPRQIWPTKYEDTGFGWMKGQDGGMVGYSEAEWQSVLGWAPESGSSGGFIADWFVELLWFGLAGCWLFGWAFGYFWRKASTLGGIWCVLFLEVLILSIYVPTQSVSAVIHRFTFMAIPTLILWRLSVGSFKIGQRIQRPEIRRRPVRRQA